MKITFLTVLVFLVTLVNSVSAQSTDKTVESIRKQYIDSSEKARLCETDDDRGEIGDLIMDEHRINARNHQWRAVGKYSDVYRFFYKGGNDEKHLYPDQIVLIKRKHQVSDRESTEEYLFDDAGRLILHKQNFVHDEKGPIVREVYFSTLGKVLRIVENGKPRDKMGGIDAGVVSDILKASEKLKDMFSLSLRL